ncbi:MAG: 3'-5' exonuclease [Balneolaceae bacterium]|nr:3'-5' exonuclease [Balneolaceae bacterium]
MTTPSAGPNFLHELNEPQREAVTHTEGPLLIIAGAGSGKTRVLTYRIAYILEQELAAPEQILALTFTNKAAREMLTRISSLVPQRATRLWMGTFHSIFAKIMRFEGEAIGYTKQFTIYDSSDSEAVVKRILTELKHDPKLVRPRAIQRRISDAKNQLITPEVYQQKHARSTLDEITQQVYARYEQRLLAGNAMDFDDLLVKPIKLFQERGDILEKYKMLFKYILIDEYQDTNHAQYTVTKMLAGRKANICVVGDDAQSIYAFRGADIRNILDFKNDYADAHEIPLEQNYRSTKHILSCADSIIKHNKKQLSKTLWTANQEGESVVLMEHMNEREESMRVAQKIEELHARFGFSYNEFAILYRTNAQSRVFEESLRRQGLPYQLVGGLSFYQRKEIKDVVAYLTLLVNPRDEQSLLRIINEPSRGIGAKTLQELLNQSRSTGVALWDVLAQVGTPTGPTIPKPAIPRIQTFRAMIVELQQELEEGVHLLDVTRKILEKSGYIKALIEEGSHESLTRRDNIIELQNAMAYYQEQNPNGSLASFLQEISLITDTDKYDENKPAITLMTVHASKGLEFPVVFIVGLEEELFPMGAREGEEQNLEEERRLFYVAITRAESRLFFSTCRMRYRFGDETVQLRSRFLDEVNPGVVQTESGATIKQKRDRFDLTVEHDGADDGADEGAGFGAGSGSGAGAGQKRPSLADLPPDLRVSGAKPKTARTQGLHIEYDDTGGANGSGASGAKRGGATSSTSGDDPFYAGAVVKHAAFGVGKILSRDGTGAEARVVVFFQHRGQKTLLLRAAKLTLVDDDMS